MAKVKIGEPPYCDTIRGKLGKPNIDSENSFFGTAVFGTAVFGNDGELRPLSEFGVANFGVSIFGEDSLT